MQIVKDKSLNNSSAAKISDAKIAPVARLELKAVDMIGLSWIFLDYPDLVLKKQEEVFRI